MMMHEPEMQDPSPANDDAGAGARAMPETPEELMRAASARINELEAEMESFRDRWMRAEAEIANVRARAKREVERLAGSSPCRNSPATSSRRRRI